MFIWTTMSISYGWIWSITRCYSRLSYSKTNVRVHHQPAIVQFSLAFTIIFILLGLINGFLSLITFSNKTILEIGCGIYLLSSSITTLLITITFGLKFFVLFFVQINMISNKKLISIQCYMMDFFLRILLAMGQWLNACVATEHAITIIKATRFVKKKVNKQLCVFY